MTRLVSVALAATLLVSACAGQDGDLVVDAVVRLDIQTTAPGAVSPYNEAKWQLGPDADPSSSTRVQIVAADNCGLVAEGADVQVLAIYSPTTVELRVFEATTLPGSERFNDLDCAIWPTVRITVVLPEPRGDRTIGGEHDVLTGFL